MEYSKSLPTYYDPVSVEAPGAGDIFYYQDSAVPFMRLKVTAQSRVWMFDVGVGGRHVKRKIGDAYIIGVNEARVKAWEWRRLLEDGDMPPTVRARAQRVTKQCVRVKDVWQQYYSQHLELNARGHEWCQRGYELHWEPIKNMPVAELTPLIVRKWLNDLLAKNMQPASANRQRANLKSCLRWGAAQGMNDWPMELFMAVKPFKEPERTSYLRQGEEVARMRQALQKQSQDVQDAIWLLLLTGQRRSNVLSMEWSELDLDNKMWTIPKEKSKTDRAYHVALTPAALEIITRRNNDQRYVFPSIRASKKGHLDSIHKAWGEVRTEAGLGDLRIHDLRHSVGTWLAQGGANAFQIQRAMNHASVTTSQKYIHLVANDVRDQLAATQVGLG